MNHTTIFSKILLLFLCYLCCSFSAVPVPAEQAPPEKKVTQQVKRQLKKEKRQQRRLERQRLRGVKQQQAPPKNHATLNILGFTLVVGAIGLFFLVVLFFTSLGASGLAAGVLTVLTGLACLCIILAGVIICIVGLVGAQDAERPKIGFGIAGIIIGALLLIVVLLPYFR